MVSIFTYTEAKLLSLAVEILPVSPTIRVVQANLQPVSFLRFRDEFRRGNEEEAENQQNSEHVDLLRLVLCGGREMGKKVIADAPRSPFLLY